MISRNITKLIFAGLIVACFTFSAQAATIVVTSALDPDNTTGACSSGGPCTIRQAINTAAFGDTIVFNLAASACPDGVCTLNLILGGLTIDNKSLTIEGNGAKKTIIRRGDNTQPFLMTTFTIIGPSENSTPIDINISRLSMQGGTTMAGGGGVSVGGEVNLLLDSVSIAGCIGFAGALANDIGTVTIVNSAIVGNVGSAGGIYNSNGEMHIANTTISGNQGSLAGLAGGIVNGYFNQKQPSFARLYLNNVSIVNNTHTSSVLGTAGGIVSHNIVLLRNTVIAENSATGGVAPDAFGNFGSYGSNFIGNANGTLGFQIGTSDLTGSAELLILGDNGGQTQTHGLLAHSPLIDRGNQCVVTRTCAANNPPVALVYDQRGTAFTRNWRGTIDIGAFEFQSAPATANGVVQGRVFAPNGNGLAHATVKLSSLGGGPVLTQTTSAFGYFRFENVQSGAIMALAVESKDASYTTQIFLFDASTPEFSLMPQQQP